MPEFSTDSKFNEMIPYFHKLSSLDQKSYSKLIDTKELK